MADEAPDAADETLRAEIARRLKDGLATEVWPRADTSERVNEVIARLQAAPADDLDAKLRIAGFTDHTITAHEMEQPCETCMYYLVRREFCDLPELMLPVAPHWSCRLWRI